MERRSDFEPSVASTQEECPDPQCAEGNDVDEYMGPNNTLNKYMVMINDILDLNNIS